MIDYTDTMRQIAERLLKEDRVDWVIGFRRGTLPMMNEPHFIDRPEAAQELVWDSHCGVNLANYLPDRTERIGIFAKGCDSRNIVNHIIENKISREQLLVIGVPCRGMVDKRRLQLLAPGEITEVHENSDDIHVKGRDFAQTHARRDVLQQNCSLCTHRNPVLYDELIGDLVPEQEAVDRYADVRAIEAMAPQQRWDFFEDLLAPCIRCYACRNACPLCYCPMCFVDESRPQWVGKGQDPVDVRTFHFLRAYHCAGRCTDCGACERACPVGINMRLLTKKLEKEAYDQWGWEAGLSLDQRPPLDTYRPEDPDEFIK